MQLWTDYEGVTIDGAYPLQKLLMPEGRSAFYSTAGANGETTVVRLIECHFDEEEILARWRCVAALNHANFLKFEHFGQTELEGGPVVYAVLERVDANLAEVLDRGPLSVEDVVQLATSLVAALEVLHSSGFIHEHVEPRNVFALNEIVKLRSDCIREAPEGEEGRAAKQGDVHDLATVLLQGLTQRRSMDGVSDAALPGPFGKMIRNGLDGTWSLEQIKVALESYVASQKPAPQQAAEVTSARNEQSAKIISQVKDLRSSAAPQAQRAETQLPLPGSERLRDQAGERPDARVLPHRPARIEAGLKEEAVDLGGRRLGWAVLLLLLVLAGTLWVMHRGTAHLQQGAQDASRGQAAAVPGQAQVPGSAAAPEQAARVPSQLPAESQSSPRVTALDSAQTAGAHAGWHVIAFTYNRRADAEKKVATIERTRRGLAPAVFSPNGRAPYMVSLGGVMGRDAAYALARRARSLGLARDVFARNYSR